MEHVVEGFGIAGVAILVVGSVVAITKYIVTFVRGRRGEAFGEVRHGVGRAILLGLEVLIIADIVQTITINRPSRAR